LREEPAQRVVETVERLQEDFADIFRVHERFMP
jgi:hypothetical protein